MTHKWSSQILAFAVFLCAWRGGFSASDGHGSDDESEHAPSSTKIESIAVLTIGGVLLLGAIVEAIEHSVKNKRSARSAFIIRSTLVMLIFVVVY